MRYSLGYPSVSLYTFNGYETRTSQTARLVRRMARWVMHIDMDAFFASVEQYRIHPEYQGIPLCVGHDPKGGQGRGVVRAASYEARAYGIRSGTPVSQAYQLCPDAIFIAGDFANYTKASAEVMRILVRFADGGHVRRTSIDEAYIEVTQKATEYASLEELAETVQRTIRDETKLPCSIGIAPNMAVAKIATSLKKPLGITLAPHQPEALRQFLAPLGVDAINGVGPATTRWLNQHGLRTVEQVQQMTLQELQAIMGRSAKWLHDRANGIDDRPLVATGPWQRKSISKDWTFEEDIAPASVERLRSALTEMCARIGHKLETKRLLFRTVTVKIRYRDFTTLQRSHTLPVGTNDPATLSRTALSLFQANERLRQPLRLLGVKVSSLSSADGQSNLLQFAQ
jgi:DNA polymerase IV (DinB-like DNA polymerase)